MKLGLGKAGHLVQAWQGSSGVGCVNRLSCLCLPAAVESKPIFSQSSLGVQGSVLSSLCTKLPRLISTGMLASFSLGLLVCPSCLFITPLGFPFLQGFKVICPFPHFSSPQNPIAGRALRYSFPKELRAAKGLIYCPFRINP